ncbi:10646_t:CDS:2, partial [Funneliformis caledonium]
MSNVTEYNLSNLPTAETVLELEENDINVIFSQNVTGKAFLRLKEEQLTRDPGPFKLLFGPASAIAGMVKQINGDGNQEQESLKRHIEKVVKEKVSDLRRDVKKVRYFAEAWLSSP